MEDIPKGSIRAIIDFFEDNCKNETAKSLNKKMSKSFSGLSYSERSSKSAGPNENTTLFRIDQKLINILGRLKNYRVYVKERHIAFHEELIDIISLLCDVDNTNEIITSRKKDQLENVKVLFQELDGRLPNAAGYNQELEDVFSKPSTWKKSYSKDNNLKEPRLLSTKRSQSFNSPPIASSEFLIGGAGGIRRPTPSVGFDTVLRGKSEFKRSASEEPVDAQNKPNDSYTRWSNYEQLRGRRRPVSLGGTIVTLQSPEDIISSIKSSQIDENLNGEVKTENQETSNSNDDNLQSVNLLKKYFELKSGEEKKQLSFSAKEDQEELSVTHEESDEVSSNDTIVEGEEEDDNEEVDSKRVSLKVDEVEGLNTPVLRHEEIDDGLVRKLIIEAEERDSICSEQSLYLDPVD